MIFYHALAEDGRLHIVGTQADARAINKDFRQVDIPVDKAGLMQELQRLYGYIDDLKVKGPEKPVAVTLEQNGEVTVIARFDTVAEAEDFLATSATIDPDLLDAGMYGVDAPETVVNPPPVKVSQAESYSARSVVWDELFPTLPLAHQLHFAAMAMESARAQLPAEQRSIVTQSFGEEQSQAAE